MKGMMIMMTTTNNNDDEMIKITMVYSSEMKEVKKFSARGI